MKNNFNETFKKNRLSGLFIVASVLILSILATPVSADEIAKEKPTEVQLSKIKNQCPNLKAKIRKIRSQDALLRVNLGKNYETIANNLMSNLNARIALNKKNGANLILATSDFDQNFKYFKDNYQLYERELSNLVDIDCSQRSREFYLQLEKTRKLRKELNYSTTKLNEIVHDYSVKVEDFLKANFGSLNQNINIKPEDKAPNGTN